MTYQPHGGHFVPASKKAMEHEEQLCNHPDFDPVSHVAILESVWANYEDIDRTKQIDCIEFFHLHFLTAVNTLGAMMSLNVTSLADLEKKLDGMTVENLNSLLDRS
jgi:hypothetical protein